MSTDVDDRVRRANPVRRTADLEPIYGHDVRRLLLREAKRGTVVRMHESDTDDKITELSQPIATNRTRGWLVALGIAAVALVIAATAIVFRADRGNDSAAPAPATTIAPTTAPPATTADPAVDAIAVVESSYQALNQGDLTAWLEHYTGDAVISGIRRSEAESRYAPMFAANVQRELTGPCTADEPSEDGLVTVLCEHVQRNDFHAPGGLETQVTLGYIVGSDGLIRQATLDNTDYRTFLRYNTQFWFWLEDNHPDVYAEIDPDLEVGGDSPGTGSKFPHSAAAMELALMYVADFVADSADYPIGMDG